MGRKGGMSKRQIARDIKREKEIYLKKLLPNVNTTETEYVSSTQEIDFDDFMSTSSNDYNTNSRLSLKEKLKQWYIKYNPSRECVESLLKILKEENLDVPSCLKNLIDYSEKITIRTVSPGNYWHYGIKNQLQKISHVLNNYNEVIFDINIDGLPLFKSSKLSLWPILGKIVNIKNIKVFLIGTYLGDKKPANVENFLHDFIVEAKDLLENGLEINNKKVQMQIRAIICDAPAKSFVCGITGHTSLRGCTKCIQIGQKIDKVVVFEAQSATLISDRDFLERKYPFLHQNYFQTRKTPLENIGVNMITK